MNALADGSAMASSVSATARVVEDSDHNTIVRRRETDEDPVAGETTR